MHPKNSSYFVRRTYLFQFISLALIIIFLNFYFGLIVIVQNMKLFQPIPSEVLSAFLTGLKALPVCCK